MNTQEEDYKGKKKRQLKRKLGRLKKKYRKNVERAGEEIFISGSQDGFIMEIKGAKRVDDIHDDFEKEKSSKAETKYRKLLNKMKDKDRMKERIE